jgi:hypothetical protein
MSMFYVQKGLKDFGLDAANKFLIFETRLDAQSLFLTPNTESVYGMQFLDLKRDGPKAQPAYVLTSVSRGARFAEIIGKHR